MRTLLKLLLFLILICVVVVGGAWFWGGRMAGPALELRQPDKFIGQATPLELRVDSPQNQAPPTTTTQMRMRKRRSLSRVRIR